MLGLVGEMCVLALFIGLATGVSHLSVTCAVVVLILVGLGLIPERRPKQDSKRLVRSHILLLVCLLVLASSMQSKLMSTSAYIWLWAPACVLVAVGLARMALQGRTHAIYEPKKFDWLLAAMVTLPACLVTAASVRIVLAFRSTMPIAPGKLASLPVMLVVCLCWLGLVVHLKSFAPFRNSAIKGWFWERRYLGAVLIILGMVLIRQKFYI